MNQKFVGVKIGWLCQHYVLLSSNVSISCLDLIRKVEAWTEAVTQMYYVKNGALESLVQFTKKLSCLGVSFLIKSEARGNYFANISSASA